MTFMHKIVRIPLFDPVDTQEFIYLDRGLHI